MAELTIRPMLAEEIQWMIDQAAAEGWNPGLHDAEPFYQADPQGFLLAELEGEKVGCISAVAYPGQFGFIGCYIVVPAYRGRGYGWRLWQAGMNHLRNCNVGLDGVVAQQDNYKRSGFRLVYRNIRFHGQRDAALPVLSGDPELTVLAATEADRQALFDYDRRYFPAERSEFLASWIRQPDSVALVSLTADTISGLAVIRPCLSGYKVGPLFADSQLIAESLLQQLLMSLPEGAEFYLDVPECHPQAVALAQRMAMQSVFETARMYTGEAPAMRMEGIFGVTTFELG